MPNNKGKERKDSLVRRKEKITQDSIERRKEYIEKSKDLELEKLRQDQQDRYNRTPFKNNSIDLFDRKKTEQF